MHKFKQLIFSNTFKDSALLYLGNIISLLINLIITFFLTRSLGVSEFGIFITGLVFVQLLVDLFELGINSAVLNYLPKQSNYNQTLVSSLFLKLVVSLLVSIVIFLVAKPISLIYFSNPLMENIIQYSGFGVLFLSLIFWLQSVFQAKKDFLSATLLNTSINIVRLLTILGLLLSNNLNLLPAYLLFNLVLVLPVLFFSLRIKNLLGIIQLSKGEILKILKFGFPVGLGFGMAAIYTKLDQLMLFNIAGDTQAGIYGLANRLAMPLIYAVAAISAAIAPRYSSLEDKKFNNYFNKTVAMVSVLSFLAIVSLPILTYLLPLLFTTKFMESIPTFQVLVIGNIFFLLSMPFTSAIVYRFGKPKFVLFSSGVSLLLIILLLKYLIPIYLSFGAALSIAVVYLIQLLVSVVYFYKINNIKIQPNP